MTASDFSRDPGSASDDALSAGADVCLVSMPYASLSRPSMALGLLRAILEADALSVSVAQADLWFAETIGLRRYEICASDSPIVNLAGEWTFAGAAFADDPRREEKDAEYLRQVHVMHESSTSAQPGHQPVAMRRPVADALIRDLWAMRSAATLFVDEAARRVLATGARVVGCTSTFEQHVASLALLRRIRELDPDVITMLGGANCETVMGETTHRCFPWVDYLVSGEADGIIAGLCRLALSRGRAVEPGELPRGVLGPGHRAAEPGPARPGRLPRAVFSDLDSLPTPRFDAYFQTLAESSLRSSVRPGLPVETSRGCWWGAVHQCTFCGLNGTGMGYRSKSAERVLAELNELEDRYGISDFEAVDNILDMGYFKSLLPTLAADGRQRRFFYEIKANTTRERIEEMLRAGITWVQPGIENLHTEVLRLMDKGIQGWQNVQLMKWARELGLRLSWSILWGFPGEKDEWYEEMAGWIPALEHIPPPAATVKLRFDRYSVYHEQARKYGLILFPIGSLSFVYPVGAADLEGLAYFFSTEPGAGPLRYQDGEKEAVLKRAGIRAVRNAVFNWQVAHAADSPPVLSMADRGGELEIIDSRSCRSSGRHVLTGLARAVCLACDAAPRQAKLAEIIARDHGITATDGQFAEITGKLLSDRLILPMDDRYMGLALKNAPRLPDSTQFPGGHVAVNGVAGHADAESR
jgi:ribosomal peptide maturation radical SAM protein 1